MPRSEANRLHRPVWRPAAPDPCQAYAQTARYARALFNARRALLRPDWPDASAVKEAVMLAAPDCFTRLVAALPEVDAINGPDVVLRALKVLMPKRHLKP